MFYYKTAAASARKADEDIKGLFALSALIPRSKQGSARGTIPMKKLVDECIDMLTYLDPKEFEKFKPTDGKSIGIRRDHHERIAELKEKLSIVESALGLLSTFKSWAPEEGDKNKKFNFEKRIKIALMACVPLLAKIDFHFLMKASPCAAAVLIYHEHACQQITYDPTSESLGLDPEWDGKEQVVIETYTPHDDACHALLLESLTTLQDYRGAQNLAMKTATTVKQQKTLRTHDSKSILDPSPATIRRRASTFSDSGSFALLPLSDLVSVHAMRERAKGLQQITEDGAKKPEDGTQAGIKEQLSVIAALNSRLAKLNIDPTQNRDTGFTQAVSGYSSV